MTAYRVPYHPEAFQGALSHKRKRPRVQSDQHLRFIRSLPCCVCGTRVGVEAAHIRMAAPAYGKRDTGIGQKADDRWTLPLCRQHHDEQHRGAELEFWRHHGIDPFVLALAIFGCGETKDEEAAEHAIRLARKQVTP